MQWYGVWNLETKEFYPLYCANYSHLERIVANMNVEIGKILIKEYVYTIRKVDIDKVLRLK